MQAYISEEIILGECWVSRGGRLKLAAFWLYVSHGLIIRGQQCCCLQESYTELA